MRISLNRSSVLPKELCASFLAIVFNTSDLAKQGVDRSIELRSMADTQLTAYIMKKMWEP